MREEGHCLSSSVPCYAGNASRPLLHLNAMRISALQANCEAGTHVCICQDGQRSLAGLSRPSPVYVDEQHHECSGGHAGDPLSGGYGGGAGCTELLAVF